MITSKDIEYYSKTYVKMHGPIDSQDKMVSMLNWVEDIRKIPEARRKKILRIKNRK
jgi:hypothetical protein